MEGIALDTFREKKFGFSMEQLYTSGLGWQKLRLRSGFGWFARLWLWRFETNVPASSLSSFSRVLGLRWDFDGFPISFYNFMSLTRVTLYLIRELEFSSRCLLVYFISNFKHQLDVIIICNRKIWKSNGFLRKNKSSQLTVSEKYEIKAFFLVAMWRREEKFPLKITSALVKKIS